MNNPNGSFRVPPDALFILFLFEPFSQKCQRLVGLDCFFWAKLSMRIGAITIYLILGAVIFLSPALPLLLLLILATALICVRVKHHHRRRCHACNIDCIKKEVYKELAQGMRNFRILDPNRWYLGVMSTVLIVSYMMLTGMSPVLAVAFGIIHIPYFLEYGTQCFCACTPLPPNKSKLREKWEALKEWWAEQKEGGLVPQPA
jgi:hypothetical protein